LVDWRCAAAFTPEIQELLIATGFLRTAADETLQDELNTPDIRHAVLTHTMETVASNLLGLTVHCARCHDHKYDPIPQEDYYRLLAVFAPASNTQSWVHPARRETPDVSPSERSRIERQNAEIERQVQERRARLAALRRPYEDRLLAVRLTSLPAPIRADTQAALQAQPTQRNEVQKYLVAKLGPLLKVAPQEVMAALSHADRAADRAIRGETETLTRGRRAWGTIQAVYDVGPPPPVPVLRRGELASPGAVVQPGLLRVLCESAEAALLRPVPPSPKASGRRLALARRLTDACGAAGGPVARVLVNPFSHP